MNVRRHDWQGRSRGKMVNMKGCGTVRIFPEQVLIRNLKVLLVEGEYDAIVGNQLGIPTVTWTGGATAWNSDFDHLFEGKIVFLSYDDDAAGQEGESLVANKLRDIESDAVEVNHLYIGLPDCKDITDLSQCKNGRIALSRLKEELRGWPVPITDSPSPSKICPTCKRPYEKK